MKGYVSDVAFPAPQPAAFDRPPTKAEVWAYITHVYSGLLSQDEMKAKALRDWAGNYKYWVNVKGWKKQPDWVEGQPVIAAACPAGLFFHEAPHINEIERLWQVARAALIDPSQLTLEAA